MVVNRRTGWIVAAGFAGLLAAAPARAAEPPQKVAAGASKTKELLLLMDVDRNGKVSRDEFMKFMAASSMSWTPIMMANWMSPS